MNTFEEVEPQEIALPPFEAIDKGWMLITGVKPDGTWNTMTASWGGLGTLWGMPVVYAFVRSTRFTKEFLDAGDTATFSMFEPGEYREGLGILGSRSGRDGDKVGHSGLTPVDDGETVYFGEAGAVIMGTKLFAQELDLECLTTVGRELKVDEKWYAPESGGIHTLYIYRADKVLVAEDDDYVGDWDDGDEEDDD